LRRRDKGLLRKLVASASEAIEAGKYEVRAHAFPRRSLLGAIRGTKQIPIIAEVKFRSPAEGQLRSRDSPAQIAKAYQEGGAAGISVLTEAAHFDGSLEFIPQVKRAVALPVLMKDIIIGKAQIDAADRLGADAVLLITSIFADGLAEPSLEEMTAHAHSRGLEVLLEAHEEEEYRVALKSDADLVGINNRDLNTLEVALETSYALLKYPREKPVVCESGIRNRADVISLMRAGADALLIGSALMRPRNVAAALRRLTGA